MADTTFNFSFFKINGCLRLLSWRLHEDWIGRPFILNVFFSIFCFLVEYHNIVL